MRGKKRQERGKDRKRSTRQRERMVAADKLQARNTQTTAEYENDESGITVTLQ